MTKSVENAVREWLDDAATSMGGEPKRRRDVLLELETTILDRVDDRTRTGQVPEEAVRDVLEMMGDPVEVGSSFVPTRPLIAPHQTRPFVLQAAVVFAAHFLLVIGSCREVQAVVRLGGYRVGRRNRAAVAGRGRYHVE